MTDLSAVPELVGSSRISSVIYHLEQSLESCAILPPYKRSLNMRKSIAERLICPKVSQATRLRCLLSWLPLVPCEAKIRNALDAPSFVWSSRNDDRRPEEGE